TLEDLDRRVGRELAHARDGAQRIDERIVPRDEHRDRNARAAERGAPVHAEQVLGELSARAYVRAEEIALIVRELLGRDLRGVREDPPVKHRERLIATERSEQRADG